MNIYKLKECPRCMGTDGFQRISTVEQTDFFRWGSFGPVGSITKSLEQYQYHCICCGVIIEDELKEIG